MLIVLGLYVESKMDLDHSPPSNAEVNPLAPELFFFF